jgi:hypothetical protein
MRMILVVDRTVLEKLPSAYDERATVIETTPWTRPRCSISCNGQRWR